MHSLRCWLGFHGQVVRDRAANGRQVLRCSRCWRVSEYPAVDAASVAAWRMAQYEQAQRLAAKAAWRSKVTP